MHPQKQAKELFIIQRYSHLPELLSEPLILLSQLFHDLRFDRVCLPGRIIPGCQFLPHLSQLLLQVTQCQLIFILNSVQSQLHFILLLIQILKTEQSLNEKQLASSAGTCRELYLNLL